MLLRAFLELLFSGCIQAREEVQAGGTIRLYRAVPEIDLELLGAVERMVMGCLEKFRTFEEFIDLSEQRLAEDDGASADLRAELLSRDSKLLAEARAVIDEAIEYLPPMCSCSL